jgi:CDP-glycerol glycerophosphotransferase
VSQLLTVVVTVHREQAYLEEFARAWLPPEEDRVEVVAVDDGAVGHGGELLAEMAAADPRVRLVRLGRHAGLPEARARGVAAATGEHVWCTHPTDLGVNLLPAVLRRLRDTDADVLLVDHDRVDRLGTVRPGSHRRLVAGLAAEDVAAPLADHPRLARAGAVPWDKVVRRRLLPEAPAYGPAFVWPALLAAERIAGLADPRYVRRATGFGAREDEPVALVAAYRRVLRGVPADDARRSLLFHTAAEHGLRLLGRCPPAARGPLADELAHLLREGGGARAAGLPGPLAVLRGRLVERGDLAAYRALERAAEAGRVARHPRRPTARRVRAWRAARGRARRPIGGYEAARRRPVDPDLALFAAYWFRGYQCNPRAIYERARELVPGLRGVWVVDEAHANRMPAGVETVTAGTPAYFDAIARARVLVNNVNWPNHLVKRPGSIHVMTHHGTPLKTMGLDLRHAAVASRRMDFAALLRRCERWDYSVSSNRLSTLVWERVFPTGHETLEVGYPRNDVLATADAAAVQRARSALGLAADQVAVLYAPTHREWHDGHVPVLDVPGTAAALPADHVLLARAHYFYPAEAAPAPDRVLDVSAHPSIEELCLAADVLVTDYSSLMFDYAVLDRPIVIHAPDWEDYRNMRGTYFDLLAEPPGAVTRTDRELVDVLRSGALHDGATAELRMRFRERFCALDDGHAAARVVERVWDAVPAAPAALEAAR